VARDDGGVVAAADDQVATATRCRGHTARTKFAKEWRTAREELGVADATTHSFRKTIATLIDDEGLSAQIGADHLGHSHVSMTQDRYMTRGRIHTQVADLLDRTVQINDE
jgi:integrase